MPRSVSRIRYSTATWVLILATLALITAACGDDAAPATTATVAAAPTTTVAPIVTTTTATSTTTATTASPPQRVDITAVDYAFEGVPDVIPAGTRLGLVNQSADEFHMAVIVRLDADDDRSAEELVALEVADIVNEAGDEFALGTPQAVMMARPGEAQYAIPVGSPVVFNPGRYAVFCAIPVGADPAVAENRANVGPPPPEDFEGTVPHYQNGMFAEFTVEG